MFEIYLNIAEWDEGVFGAEAAAQHYFGVPASALTRRQAALLATALPAPQTAQSRRAIDRPCPPRRAARASRRAFRPDHRLPHLALRRR